MPAKNSKTNIVALVTICFLFFIFGFVTWANGTLIPFFKIAFELSDTKAFLVATASYMAYFFLAIPASYILQKTGFKNGILLGLCILSLGSLLFIPAAHMRSFSFFLVAIFIQGAALALLQTAVNPYLTILGPHESAAKRISIAGICNKAAGIVVPFIMGSVFLKNAAAVQQQISLSDGAEKEALLQIILSRVHTPYVMLAIIFLVVAFVIRKINLPEITAERNSPGNNPGLGAAKSIFHFPHLFLGAFCIFLYVGAEVMAGDIIGVYGTELGIDTDTTKYFTSLTLTGMLIGYIAGIIAIPKYISQQLALKICALLGAAFSVAAYCSNGYTAIFFIAMLGLANSLMWPAIFPLGIHRLGQWVKTGSAIMVMGIVGGAIWPLVYAYLKDSAGLSFQLSYLVTVLPCYIYILYFAVKGYKAGLSPSKPILQPSNEPSVSAIKPKLS